jgi:hypothetical protein
MGLCALNGAGVINQANNVAIGAFAGAAVTLGANTLVGFCSGASLTGTPGNTFIGCGAGRSSTTGQANTVIGCGAMGTGVVTGSNNFAGGILAGDALTSGSTNTFLGYTSGRLVTTGGQNTIVGAYGGTTALANNVVLADGAGTIRFQSNSSGAISLGAGGAYGTAGQVLTSAGTGGAPTWSTPQTLSTTATKATVAATPLNLLSFAGAVRMGTLTVMLTDNATNVAWANITIASNSGVGSSIVTTSAGTFGTFTVTTNVGNDTLVTFTPSATLASVDAVYKYTASFGAQPTVL